MILVCSIKCFKKEAGETKKLGITSLVLIILYYFWWYFVVSVFLTPVGTGGIILIPFISVFGVAIGAILNIAAK